MCFGGGQQAQQQPAAAPAPAPAPAMPAPTETEIGAARRGEERSAFGASGTPSTRVDRSVQGGAMGGSGLGGM